MKEILKPTPMKIFLSALIIIFLPVLSYQERIMCEMFGSCPPYLLHNTSIVGALLKPFNVLPLLDISTLVYLPLGILFSYILSSFILHRSGKLDRNKIHTMFKPTKPKVILFIVGVISIGPAFFSFLSGLYGGIVNFSGPLFIAYNVFEMLGIVLLPFTLVSTIFSYANSVLLRLLIAVADIPTSGMPFEPAYLSLTEGVVIFALTVVEWYILSGLLVSIYNKIRKKG